MVKLLRNTTTMICFLGVLLCILFTSSAEASKLSLDDRTILLRSIQFVRITPAEGQKTVGYEITPSQKRVIFSTSIDTASESPKWKLAFYNKSNYWRFYNEEGQVIDGEAMKAIRKVFNSKSPIGRISGEVIQQQEQPNATPNNEETNTINQSNVLETTTPHTRCEEREIVGCLSGISVEANLSQDKRTEAQLSAPISTNVPLQKKKSSSKKETGSKSMSKSQQVQLQQDFKLKEVRLLKPEQGYFPFEHSFLADNCFTVSIHPSDLSHAYEINFCYEPAVNSTKLLERFRILLEDKQRGKKIFE